MDETRTSCPICGADTIPVGEKVGRLGPTPFLLRRCQTCGYALIANPRTDYAALYDEEYYNGNGADRWVDYVTELEHPETTLRRLEWRGIIRVIESLRGGLAGVRWMDFGCGNGGLVRAGRQAGIEICGFDEGWITGRARAAGIPILDAAELGALAGTMDVVTAIEVLEHLVDPLAVLAQIRALLKPGGLFFCTTGNARPFRNKLLQWRYVIPEVHIGYFEPETLANALRKSGFEPEFPGFVPGFDDIIRFKVLKNVGVRRCHLWHGLIPWPVASRVVDRFFQVTAHPVGRAV